MLKNKNNFKLSHRQKPQSKRQLKISRLVNIAVIDCLKKGKQIDIKLIPIPLTVTKVTISTDLRIANCYFVPFNTNLSQETILKSLEKSKYTIRHYVTKTVNLKYSPEIRFFYDQAFNNITEIENLLKNL